MNIILALFIGLVLYGIYKTSKRRKNSKAPQQRQIQMTIVQKYKSEYFTVQKLCDKAMDEQLLFELN